MAEQLRNWSPGQAMLPPDPNHHNRMLDRGAAEHLREVAPWLAAAAPAPTAEAKGISREEFAKHGSAMLLLVLQDARPRYDEFVRHFNAIAECDAALRTRAREAEERAEMYVRMHRQECIDGAARLMAAFRERDEAREQRDAAQGLLSEALCNLGTARGDLATERAARLRAEAERDGALTEANDLRLRVERLVEGAAKLTERAEEAEEELRLADFRVKSAESRSDDFAARLAAAEAEVKRRDDVVDEHASDSARAGLERDRAEHRLKLATEEIVRVRLAYDDPSLDGTDGAHPAWWRGSDAGVAGAVRIVNEALDEPLPLAGCVGGANLERVRQRIAALRERAERLVEAGDVLRNLARRFRSTVYGPEEIDRAIAEWAAAKGTK